MNTSTYMWFNGFAMGLSFWVITVCGVLLAGDLNLI